MEVFEPTKITKTIKYTMKVLKPTKITKTITTIVDHEDMYVPHLQGSM